MKMRFIRVLGIGSLFFWITFLMYMVGLWPVILGVKIKKPTSVNSKAIIENIVSTIAKQKEVKNLIGENKISIGDQNLVLMDMVWQEFGGRWKTDPREEKIPTAWYFKNGLKASPDNRIVFFDPESLEGKFLDYKNVKIGANNLILEKTEEKSYEELVAFRKGIKEDEVLIVEIPKSKQSGGGHYVVNYFRW